MALLVVCLVGVVAVIALTPLNKPFVAFGLPNPDYGYITGSIFGYTVYGWNCYNGKHITVHYYSSELLTYSYSREETQCGEQTPIEKTTASDKDRRELPTSSFW